MTCPERPSGPGRLVAQGRAGPGRGREGASTSVALLALLQAQPVQ